MFLVQFRKVFNVTHVFNKLYIMFLCLLLNIIQISYNLYLRYPICLNLFHLWNIFYLKIIMKVGFCTQRSYLCRKQTTSNSCNVFSKMKLGIHCWFRSAILTAICYINCMCKLKGKMTMGLFITMLFITRY